MNGAEALVRTLIMAGVDTLFTNSGSTEMDIIRALDQVDGMRPVMGLFEGVVTGAADGYARMTGKPPATLLHVAPGLANGLANLHNARRACSPIVNIVGDYPSYHRGNDPLLGGDLESLAKSMSGWVSVAAGPDTIAQDGADAVRAARQGQVATLIVPQDATWDEAAGPVDPHPDGGPPSATGEAVDKAAEMLRGGGTYLIVNGSGLSQAGLAAAGRIVAATGCQLLVEVFHARIERGAGRGVFGPLHGGQKEAAEQLSRAQRVVLAGTRPPVASLTYPGLPGLFIPDETPCHQLARQNDDVAGALEAVAEALGATARGAIYDHVETGPPRGPVDPKSIGRAIAATLPENAIVAAEATTSGGPIFGSTRTCRPHSWLGMTGGSIGLALPLSTGAAVACPDRKVLCIQSDGGGMYVNQALWTHAREGLDIVTVILTNRRYRILEHEYLKDGSNQVGPVAGRLFDLGNPSIEWTHLAKGMGVEAQKAETAEDLTTALDRGFAEPGPYLIDAVMDGT